MNSILMRSAINRMGESYKQHREGKDIGTVSAARGKDSDGKYLGVPEGTDVREADVLECTVSGMLYEVERVDPEVIQRQIVQIRAYYKDKNKPKTAQAPN